MTQTKSRALFWFRKDLRFAYNTALTYAFQNFEEVVALYIYDSSLQEIGSAQKVWLHHSLTQLNKKCLERLIIKSGNPLSVLQDLLRVISFDAIISSKSYVPNEILRDEQIRTSMLTSKIQFLQFDGFLLFDQSQIKTKTGKLYSVFTPFYKTCLLTQKPSSTVINRENSKFNFIELGDRSNSLKVSDLNLLPTKPDWSKKMFEDFQWQPGEDGALKALEKFISSGLRNYAAWRDYPAKKPLGMSLLSPHLALGEISPLQVWQAAENSGCKTMNIEKFQTELAWRDFSYYLLSQFPDLRTRNWNRKFDSFEWSNNPEALKRWQRGQTGFPIVDAGMRQLYKTGYMSNRLRMIVASFLTKDLFIHWKHGEEWFWDTLFDADPASNAFGWQWVAGSGADASPYFRVFNPVLQGEKFDPDGDFVRSWIPEIAKLPTKYIHMPWKAPADILLKAGVKLGETYPKPIVDHSVARKEALQRYENIKS